jgi:hypothetical protein
MHRYLRSIVAKLVVMTAIAVPGSEALAQGVTGSAVTGTVKDEGEKPLEGVSLQLRNTATGETFKAATGPSGQYFIDNVPPGGPYSLTATLAGYQTTVEEGIQLTLGQRLTLDLVLRSFGEEIKIVAHYDPLADHGRTGPSTILKSARIAELPLQGRNFTDLISTDPRVSRSEGGVSIAGQNNRYNNIQIDGGANNDLFGLAASGTPGGQANAKPLSVEAIQEFVVQVAPFDVRQGMFTGGLVNAITKSGTNDFHGSLFGYYQNKSLAWDDPKVDPTFLNFTTGQFGATLGGPIVKDQAHFFIAADIQQRQSSFGNMFQIGGVDPALDVPKAGFTNAEALRFTDILARRYGITNAGNALAPDLANPDRNVFVKITTSPAENNHLELSYNYVNARQDQLIRLPFNPTVPGRLRDGYELSNSGYGQANTTNTGRAKLTTNFGDGQWSNELLAGYSGIRDSRDLPLRAPLILVKAGKLGASDSWLAAGAERFSQANILDQDVFQLQDNLTFAHEKHRFTVGTSNEFFRFRNVFFQASIGVWAFDSLDAFEAGTPIAFQRRFGVSDAQAPGTASFDVSQLGFYLQDEWSLRDNLTLTPGVRIDVPFLSHANTNPALVNNAAFPIDTGRVPSGNILWSPRLGINWDVDGSSDTIVRGGVGVFSGRPPYVWVSNAYSINGLSQVELTCVAPPAGVLPFGFNPDPNAQPSDCTGGTGTPKAPTNQGEIDYFDPNTKYPQNLRLALGVDRRLPWGIVGSADILYTRDINGWYTTDENLNDLGTDGDGREVYGTFTAATFTTSGNTPSTSRIDPVHLRQAVKVFNKNGGHVTSLTLQLQKQFATRFAITVGYTYSRSLDRISLTSSQALSNFQFAPLDGDIQNRAVRPSAFDRPHKITIAGTAALPYGFGLGLIYVGQSGTPYTWIVNGDVNGDGINGNDVPFIPASASQISLADPTGARTPAEVYAALSAFIDGQECLRNSRGSFIQRSACRNPWQDFVDMRLFWISPNLKGQHIEVQWDIFNVLNLLNSSWGHLNQVAQFETAPSAFLRAVGYDTVAKRPIYAFTPPPTITTTVYSPTQSRWRMQLGARYLF